MKKNIIRSVTYATIVLFAASCDVVEDDHLPVVQRNLDLVVAPNKSAAIDVAKLIPELVKVNSAADRSDIQFFGNRYIAYSLKNTSGDTFAFDTETATSRIQTNVRIKPLASTTACESSGAFEHAEINSNSSLVVNLFNNSEFCGFDAHGSGFGVSVASGIEGDFDINTEGLLISICACGNAGYSAILTYVPPPGFVGQVKFTYHLGVFDAGKSGPDITHPEEFLYYGTHVGVIDVVAP
jgi:hypothetical protein